MACGDVLLCLGYRLMRRAFRPEPVTVFGECWVPSALQYLHHRLLDQSIQHRRDAKLSHPAVRLRDFHPSHRLWLVIERLASRLHEIVKKANGDFSGFRPQQAGMGGVIRDYWVLLCKEELRGELKDVVS